MTGILGVVASSISVASLAIQIADSLNKVISFCETIREAPVDVQQLILQLHLLTNIASVIRNMIESGTVPNTLEPTLERALKLVRHDIAILSILSSELDRKLKSERMLVRTWARVQTVFSEKKISLLKSHLESAKGGLNLLQGCIIIEKVSILDSMTRQLPKALGHCWERGGLEDHVTIDDGLGEPMVVPLELCSRPQDLVRVLDIKYSSRILPGLCQVQRGHLAIFDWTQNFKIDAENWESAVKPGGRVKVAFLMSTFYGLSRTKCARCFKPHTQRLSELGFNKCFSCGLEVLRVEPEAITFETSDISIGLGPDQYRNYQLSTRKKKSSAKENNPTSNEPETPNPASKKGNENPPIDLVCKRIVVKWEPMLNIVHRYLYCRCVIRRSTPSTIEKELTLLILAYCPRHNVKGASRQDYGDIDYHQDSYFEQFGGYRNFQGFIYLFAPNIYLLLGGEKFLPAEQHDEAVKAIDEYLARDFQAVKDLLFNYCYEVNDELGRAGVDLPQREAEFVKAEGLGRREEMVERRKEIGFQPYDADLSWIAEQTESLYNSPMMKEVREILAGKFDGKAHWAIEN